MMRNQSTMLWIIITLLLLSTVSLALDPPTKLWEKWYYTSYDTAKFYDFELTASGELFVTGGVADYWTGGQIMHPAMLFDLDGNLIWELDMSWYGILGWDGAVLPDGSFVITGRSVETPSDTYALFIMKIAQNGFIEWTKVYDYPTTREEGYGITCLPDGGFAVVGRVNGTGSVLGDAWILRTDSNGDTLWTEMWGISPSSYGKSVVYTDNTICALVYGMDDTLTTRGTILLCYDLDSNYLWGRNYPESNDGSAIDICLASDGGFTFVSQYSYQWPRLLHTDQVGNLLWYKAIYVTPNDDHESYCIRQTMDSGYIFSGWDGYNPGPWDNDQLEHGDFFQAEELSGEDDYDDYQEGWLVRFDSEGNELWSINNTTSANHHFYSCLQLPEGGYMACGTWGGSGYLIRYAPETGIEQEEQPPLVTLEVTPNPFTENLSVNFNLPEEMNVTLTIYDLNGRIVDVITKGSFLKGNHSVQWIPSGNLSSGCYLVQISTTIGLYSRACILLY